jgi:hypothetical protein
MRNDRVVIFYKIRSKSTGKFRCAGGEPKWNGSGKTFVTLGRLRQMISNCMQYNTSPRGSKNDFSDWEIVEYEVTEKEVKGVHEIVKADKLISLLQR